MGAANSVSVAAFIASLCLLVGTVTVYMVRVALIDFRTKRLRRSTSKADQEIKTLTIHLRGLEVSYSQLSSKLANLNSKIQVEMKYLELLSRESAIFIHEVGYQIGQLTCFTTRLERDTEGRATVNQRPVFHRLIWHYVNQAEVWASSSHTANDKLAKAFPPSLGIAAGRIGGTARFVIEPTARESA